MRQFHLEEPRRRRFRSRYPRVDTLIDDRDEISKLTPEQIRLYSGQG